MWWLGQALSGNLSFITPKCSLQLIPQGFLAVRKGSTQAFSFFPHFVFWTESLQANKTGEASHIYLFCRFGRDQKAAATLRRPVVFQFGSVTCLLLGDRGFFLLSSKLERSRRHFAFVLVNFCHLCTHL